MPLATPPWCQWVTIFDIIQTVNFGSERGRSLSSARGHQYTVRAQEIHTDATRDISHDVLAGYLPKTRLIGFIVLLPESYRRQHRHEAFLVAGAAVLVIGNPQGSAIFEPRPRVVARDRDTRAVEVNEAHLLQHFRSQRTGFLDQHIGRLCSFREFGDGGGADGQE